MAKRVGLDRWTFYEAPKACQYDQHRSLGFRTTDSPLAGDISDVQFAFEVILLRKPNKLLKLIYVLNNRIPVVSV
jgi:hypothetical protein